MIGEEATIGSLGIQVGRVPTIATDEGGGDAFFFGLRSYQVDYVVVIGQDDDIGFGNGNLSQNGGEVGVFATVIFGANVLTTTVGEFFGEVFGQALDVVIGLIGHHESGLGFHGIHSEFGHHFTLLFVVVACYEGIGFDFAGGVAHDARVGGCTANLDDVLLIDDFGNGDGGFGADFANDVMNFILIDDFVGRVDSGFGGALAVFNDGGNLRA